MSFSKSTAGMTKNIDEQIPLDASSKDMSKYYRPDFRSMGNSFKTISQPDDQEKEANFKISLNPNVDLSTLSFNKRPKSRTHTSSKTQIQMKDPYIDHLEEVGKIILERHRHKEREVSP